MRDDDGESREENKSEERLIIGKGDVRKIMRDGICDNARVHLRAGLTDSSMVVWLVEDAVWIGFEGHAKELLENLIVWSLVMNLSIKEMTLLLFSGE